MINSNLIEYSLADNKVVFIRLLDKSSSLTTAETIECISRPRTLMNQQNIDGLARKLS